MEERIHISAFNRLVNSIIDRLKKINRIMILIKIVMSEYEQVSCLVFIYF